MQESNSLFSSRGQVLFALASNPDLRLRDLAEELGMSPRGVQEIVSALAKEGLLERTREGRRNHYLVRRDRPIAGPDGGEQLGTLLDAISSRTGSAPSKRQRAAIVLACSDYRYQEPLRDLLSSEGLLFASEMFLWPGGSSALAGPDAWSIIGAMKRALGTKQPDRIVLVAHQGCRVPGAYLGARGNPVATAHAVEGRRRRGAELVKREFRTEPELWFLSQRGPLRVHSTDAQPDRLTSVSG